MSYPRFPVAVHILLMRGDDVLLLRRCNTGFEDGKLRKCSELLWANPADVPDDTIPYVRAGIENLRSGIWFQEFGWKPSGPLA